MGPLESLLRAGADKDVANRYCVTPLFTALFHNHKDCVDLLLRAGADQDKDLLHQYLPLPSTPASLQALIALNFRAVPKPRPPLQKLQHSAIHFAITHLKFRADAVPVAQQILATFPSDHPTLPLLDACLKRKLQDCPVSAPTHLPEELRAKMIAELIDEDDAPKKKKKGKK